jgi:hypothetical protein
LNSARLCVTESSTTVFTHPASSSQTKTCRPSLRAASQARRSSASRLRSLRWMISTGSCSSSSTRWVCEPLTCCRTGRLRWRVRHRDRMVRLEWEDHDHEMWELLWKKYCAGIFQKEEGMGAKFCEGHEAEVRSGHVHDRRHESSWPTPLRSRSEHRQAPYRRRRNPIRRSVPRGFVGHDVRLVLVPGRRHPILRQARLLGV